MSISWNEISANANGGTEQTARIIEARLGSKADDFWIVPSRVRELDNSKYRIYWAHDTADDPETKNAIGSPDRWGRFHRIVFCGDYQRTNNQRLWGIPADHRSVVIDTPITPISFNWFEKQNYETIDLVYTSTPQRGLDILIPVFTELAKEFPQLRLHVFSSFKIYGFDDADRQFEPLYAMCREHPQIIYHGHKSNSEVREQLVNSHILAYPSTWIESNSRSLIEAMSAGLLCVHSDLGGLPDTSGGLTRMYSYTPDKNVHAQLFYTALRKAISDHIVWQDGVVPEIKFVKQYADTRFNIDRIAYKWECLLEDIREEYQGAGLVLAQNEVKEFKL